MSASRQSKPPALSGCSRCGMLAAGVLLVFLCQCTVNFKLTHTSTCYVRFVGLDMAEGCQHDAAAD